MNHKKVRVEAPRVGRFYYRRPAAESSADVFDRVTQFWRTLLEDNGSGHGVLTHENANYDMCVVVTHGLTIRLMLMCLFEWSVDTFESVWNLENCEYLMLKKNTDKQRYEICIEESNLSKASRNMPWATRKVWVVFKDFGVHGYL